MLTLARESLYEVVEDIAPLLSAHSRELTNNRDRVVLDPMWEKYAQLEASAPNALQIFTAREDGKLVGYAVFMVQPHLHYRALFPAINDLLYTRPEERGTTGLRLIRFCEQELAAVAHKIVWHAKPGTVLEKLLPKLGYAPEESIWGKFLDKSAAAQEN